MSAYIIRFVKKYFYVLSWAIIILQIINLRRTIHEKESHEQKKLLFLIS